jgi:O-antigen/teichoic acid export membrane protein
MPDLGRTYPEGSNSLLSSKIEETEVAVVPETDTASSVSAPLFSRLLGSDRPNLLRRLLPFARNGGLSILDQGLISGSNFLISVLLARWLIPAQYGAYAVAFGIYILLTLVYQSLVLEPMMVYGGSTHRNNLRGYLRPLLSIHVILSLAIFLIFGASAAVAYVWWPHGGLSGALVGVTLASPCALLFALARRCFYLELSPGQSVVGAALYCALVLSGLWIFNRHGLLSAFTAFVLLGLGALGTSVLLLLRLKLPAGGPIPSTSATWRQHYQYGGWALAGAIASWIPAYIYYPLVSSFGSMAQSGQLKALMNFTLPLEQIKGALALLLLPYAARIHDQDEASSTKLMVARMSLIGAGVAIAYWAVMVPLQRPLFHFLYSDRYNSVAHLLPVVAFGSIVWTAAFGPTIALRGMKSPSAVFVAFGWATILSLAIGIPATWAFGLSGGIWGTNIADLASLIGVSILLRRKLAAQPTAQV